MPVTPKREKNTRAASGLAIQKKKAKRKYPVIDQSK